MITDKEILENYANVPVQTAAKYLGWSPSAVYEALKQGIAPFGVAVKMSSEWTYHIPAKLLVAYQNGKVPTNLYLDIIRGSG